MRAILLAFVILFSGCDKEKSPAPATKSETKPAQGQPEPPKQTQHEGTVYGPGVSAAGEIVPISKIFDEVDAYDGKTVKVAGTIVDVCPNRGCWIDIAGDREFDVLRFKVTDGVMTFPLADKGKHVVAEGVVRKIAPDPAAAPAEGAGHACDGEMKGEAKPAAAGHEGHGGGEAAGAHDCAGPAKAKARLEGIGAVVHGK